MTELATIEGVEPLSQIEVGQLKHYEEAVERSLKGFKDAGEALAEIRDRELYRIPWLTFEAYLDGRWGISRRHGYRLMQAAAVTDRVTHGTQMPDPSSERVARAIGALPEDLQAQAWALAVENNGGKPATGRAVEAAGAQLRGVDESYAREERQDREDAAAVTFMQDHRRRAPAPAAEPEAEAEKKRPNDEWYTIEDHANRVRRTFGGVIHLDPSSCVRANQIIQAREYFDKARDGKRQAWCAPNGFSNYPFSEIADWIDLQMRAFKTGLVPEWITLTNSNTETAWYEDLLEASTLMCLVRGRPKFEAGDPDRLAVDENGKRKSMTGWSGITYFYMGEKYADDFAREFAPIGRILRTDAYVPEVLA